MTDQIRPLHYMLDAQGEPVACADFMQWAQWFARTQRTGERTVAQSRDEGTGGADVLVSTVFLGHDHQWGSGPPVLWETLVFGGPLDGEMERYSSRAAALRGHQRMCQKINRRGLRLSAAVGLTRRGSA